jgi:hypothetical protein
VKNLEPPSGPPFKLPHRRRRRAEREKKGLTSRRQASEKAQAPKAQGARKEEAAARYQKQ